jgi:hypothetical protein
MLNSFTQKITDKPWVLMLTIAALLAIPRFALMLQGKYNVVALIFIVMLSLPFLLLTKDGRREIGMTKPKNFLRLGISFLAGILLSGMVFWIGFALYENTSLNWYVAIMETIKGIPLASVKASPWLFAAVALPAVIFSPLGEEVFFRGMLDEACTKRFGKSNASVIDATVFAVTHLAHYGLSTVNSTFTILLPSALWWMILMGIASILFVKAKQFTGTIWGAVCCHAGFNLAMMWCICYQLA